jgi:hypothetical protein
MKLIAGTETRYPGVGLMIAMVVSALMWAGCYVVFG